MGTTPHHTLKVPVWDCWCAVLVFLALLPHLGRRTRFQVPATVIPGLKQNSSKPTLRAPEGPPRCARCPSPQKCSNHLKNQINWAHLQSQAGRPLEKASIKFSPITSPRHSPFPLVPDSLPRLLTATRKLQERERNPKSRWRSHSPRALPLTAAPAAPTPPDARFGLAPSSSAASPGLQSSRGARSLS